MMAFVNPRAAGGTALRKWRRVLPLLERALPPASIHMIDDTSAAECILRDALRRGETDFIAAGGDGTLNRVLNLLLNHADPGQRAALRLGAIGLGSSNDFHKPRSSPDDIPRKIQFNEACLRDVGKLTFREHGTAQTRYFLVNASVGATAAANLLFNTPDVVLRALKPASTTAAILYAALKTVVNFRNVDAKLHLPGGGTCTVRLTNLAILKNPHFSGNFHFPGQADYSDGRFMVRLFHRMNRRDLISALRKLSNGASPGTQNAVAWSTSELSVTADQPFAVEFDGEVVSTASVRFEILPRFLRVCTC